MFEDYLASKEDFEAIDEGINFVWKRELDFIFKDKKIIGKTIIISYDSKYLYLWSRILIPKIHKLSTNKNGYNFYKIPHKIKINDDNQRGWQVGFWIDNKGIEKYLPKKISAGNFQYPKIIGSLLEPFIKSHDKKTSAYYTRESYLATIVHEFGHVYFNQHKTWWYSNKNDNLKYLKTAFDLYSKNKIKRRISVYFPCYFNLGELYAFCTDYTAASLFWPNHKKDIDKCNLEILKKMISVEKDKNLETENSVLEDEKGGHIFSMVIGKILIEKFKKTWPQKLLNSNFRI